jgi:hypothetical protein
MLVHFLLHQQVHCFCRLALFNPLIFLSLDRWLWTSDLRSYTNHIYPKERQISVRNMTTGCRISLPRDPGSLMELDFYTTAFTLILNTSLLLVKAVCVMLLITYMSHWSNKNMVPLRYSLSAFVCDICQSGTWLYFSI